MLHQPQETINNTDEEEWGLHNIIVMLSLLPGFFTCVFFSTDLDCLACGHGLCFLSEPYGVCVCVCVCLCVCECEGEREDGKKGKGEGHRVWKETSLIAKICPSPPSLPLLL